MLGRVREHVSMLAALLSAVSLALVFGAVFRFIPASLLPVFPGLLAAVPHVNAAISATAIVVIVAAWRAVRRGDVRTHRRGMLAGVGLFASFLVLYLYRVTVLGTTQFDGPRWFDTFLYVPLLGIHVLLAVVCVPLLYYVLLLAVTRPTSAVGETRHPRLGRVTAVLWLASFVLGICVYLLLYWLF